MPLDTWNLSGTQGNVFDNPRHMIDSSQTPYLGILHSTNQSATGRIPVQKSTGGLVAKSEEQTGNTVPMSSFARTPSTMNSFSPAEIPQNSLADQQRLQSSQLHFDKSPSTFSCWKIRLKTQASSEFPSEAFLRIKEVEMVDSVDERKTSRSMKGKVFPNFEMLDARIASALDNIIQNSQFKKKVSLEDQKAQKEDRFLRGRQIAHMIYDYFRVTGANDSVENFADLFTLVLQNDDIQEFDSKWDEILLSMTKIPPDDILEGLYKLRTRESDQLKKRIGIVRHGDSSEDIKA